MRNNFEIAVKSKIWNRQIMFFLIALTLLTTTGCVQEAAKVIIIPARSSGVGAFVVVMLIAAFLQQFDKREPYNAEKAREMVKSSPPTPGYDGYTGTPSYYEKSYIGRDGFREAKSIIHNQDFLVVDFKVLIHSDFNVEVLAKPPGQADFEKATVLSAVKIAGTMTIHMEKIYPVGTEFQVKYFFQTEQASAPPAIEPPKETATAPVPDPIPTPPTQTIRNISVSVDKMFPPNTQFEVWLVDGNGRMVRRLNVERIEWRNWTLFITLGESIPYYSKYRVNCFTPQAANRPPYYPPPRGYMPFPGRRF